VQFIDEVTIDVAAGRGGHGAVAFHRDRHNPTGGPAGGDGGRGGDVILEADARLGTLLDLRYRPRQNAANGQGGMGNDCNGKNAEDLVVRVPVGTQAFDETSGELVCDLTVAGQRAVVAKGGKGGLGNMNFATPWNRSPRSAEPGGEGEARRLRLELKLLADVGIIGFPNVGKSTLISRMSRAKPKIADYPFTTLVPNLGVVQVAGERTFVMADVPGLIPGASQGAGLGIRFLKHVERTAVLLHVIAPDAGEGRGPLEDLDVINDELAAFDPELAARPQIVAWNKLDLPDAREQTERIRVAMAERGVEMFAISGVTGEGITELGWALWRRVEQERLTRAGIEGARPEEKR
jgi:GTP-binding protein